jgi:membrane protein implicated in regulation of membrane protease activity
MNASQKRSGARKPLLRFFGHHRRGELLIWSFVICMCIGNALWTLFLVVPWIRMFLIPLFFVLQAFYATLADACLRGERARIGRYILYLLAAMLMNIVPLGFLAGVTRNLELPVIYFGIAALEMLSIVAFYQWLDIHPRRSEFLDAKRRRSERQQFRDWNAEFLGKHGVTATVLSPTGIIKIDGQRYDARSAQAYVNVGQTVRVIGRSGILLVVCQTND